MKMRENELSDEGGAVGERGKMNFLGKYNE
jgi:hypothetical protein